MRPGLSAGRPRIAKTSSAAPSSLARIGAHSEHRGQTGPKAKCEKMKTPSDHGKVRRSFALRLDAASWQFKKETFINELEDEKGRSVLLDEMFGGRLVVETLHAGCRCKYMGDLIVTWNNRLIPC